MDFASGVAYTIDGKMQKLAEAIYLIVPAGIVVNAAGLRESMMTDGTLDFVSTAEDTNMQKITPIDIQHKSFKKALQGYDRTEVDAFLDEIIETLEDERAAPSRARGRSGRPQRAYQPLQSDGRVAAKYAWCWRSARPTKSKPRRTKKPT